MSKFVTIPVGGHPMEVLIEAPARRVPGPAILLMYHRGGFDHFTETVVERLCKAGYLIAVPDVSHRTTRDVRMEDRKQYFKDSEVVADMKATVEFLKTRPDVDPERLIIMGHCMGGRMVLLGAGALPNEFKGAVVLYGGGVMVSWGDEGWTPFEKLQNIRCPVVGFFGQHDTNPSPDNVNQIDAELTARGITHTFHRYHKVGHGFQHEDTPEQIEASEDAWKKIFEFLRERIPF
jgi:carboxymethylenebutenolidase